MLTDDDIFRIDVTDSLRNQVASTIQHLAINRLIPGQKLIPTKPEITGFGVSLLSELAWRTLLHRYQVPFQIIKGGQHLGSSSIGGRRCQVHGVHAKNNTLTTKLVSIQAGHPALLRSIHQRIEVFAELDFLPASSSQESRMPYSKWLLPNPIVEPNGHFQIPAKIHLELESPTQPCQVEVYGFSDRNQPVNEVVTFSRQKVRESAMTYKTISLLLFTGDLPPKIIAGKAGLDGKSISPSDWVNTRPACTSVQFLGFLHSDRLQTLLTNQLRQDQEYRIRWYRNQFHTIKAVELNPLARLFSVANELDQT